MRTRLRMTTSARRDWPVAGRGPRRRSDALQDGSQESEAVGGQSILRGREATPDGCRSSDRVIVDCERLDAQGARIARFCYRVDKARPAELVGPRRSAVRATR